MLGGVKEGALEGYSVGLVASSTTVALSTTAGLESLELSPRQREGPDVPSQAQVVGTGRHCLEVVGAA